MLTGDDYSNLINDFCATESEGVRLSPGSREGELVIEYIQDHHAHSAVFEPKTYFDFISFGSLKLLHKQHEALREQNTTLNQQQEVLQEQNTALNKQHESLQEQNAALKEEVARLNQQIFGTKSEQSSSIEDAAAEDDPVPPVVEQEPVSDAPKVIDFDEVRKKSNAGRKPLPAHLPRVRKIYELAEHDRFCPCCRGEVRPIGEEVTEQLTVIPAQYKVIEHVRKKYVCRHCETFVTAPGPKNLIQKSSYASPELLAHIACSKYQHGLPFYRQEAIFEQSGLPFNRTTLANLMIGCSDRLIALYETLHQELLRQDAIHADETPIQVLKEEGRKAQSKSWLWLYRSRIDALCPIILFEYTPTRAGANPKRFLRIDIDGERPYRGFLQVDGYAGYNGLSGVTRVGCMAHVRRKFMAIIKTLPSGTTGTHAHKAIALIGKLYEIERRLNGQSHQIRYEIRQAESIPILDEFKAWLDEMHSKATGSLGAAVRYARDQWPAFRRYVDDGCLAIDNNIAERDIKSVVIGRKNWLFADSVAGAHTNAIMYSLVLTAKANGIDPFVYLKYVIETMPTLSKGDDVQCLLPWNMPKQSFDEERLAA